MKVATDLELEFIDRFVRKAKRDRLHAMASAPDKRDKMLREFSSPAIFDDRFVIEFDGNDRNRGLLPELYKQQGLGGRVYVMSENSEWDAQKFQMSYIVDECLAMCIDTIGYCWKTRMAFYEWHHSGTSYLLKR